MTASWFLMRIWVTSIPRWFGHMCGEFPEQRERKLRLKRVA